MRRAIVACCSALAALSVSTAALEVDKQQLHAHIQHENRVGKDWNYIPNYGLVCEEVGCCGLPTPEKPNRQACGPEYWRYMNTNTSNRCVSSTGGQQTPINFQTVGNDTLDYTDILELTGSSEEGKSQGRLVYSENLCAGSLEFLANTWEVVFDKNCTLHVDVLGKRWRLVQWHLHNAEHAINGMYYPLEVHMVHQNAEGDVLVIGVFLTTGTTNRFFDQLQSEQKEERLKPLDPYEIIVDGKYWHYTGSLTTPPCQPSDTGMVQWFVMQTPDTVTTEDLFMFTSYFANLDKAYDGHVNRPLQDVLQTTEIYVNHDEPAAHRHRKKPHVGKHKNLRM